MSIIHVARDGAVAIITMNRPEAMNALSAALRAALADAMAALQGDDGVRAIVLTGAGQRAFTAGLDLKELGADTANLGAANADNAHANPVLAVEQCTKPVIGAINGVAITGGFELALACDVLVASTNARFADTHARVGILPGWGLSQKLSRAIGIYRARQLSLTGNFLDAETALQWGLINQMVPPDALLPTAIALAQDMASVDPVMSATYKALINDGFAMTLADGLALEQRVSRAANGQVRAQDVEQRRRAVMERGRTQN
ncbi:MAG: enoyl-CoA hydratase [Sphingopyxis sp.]